MALDFWTNLSWSWNDVPWSSRQLRLSQGALTVTVIFEFPPPLPPASSQSGGIGSFDPLVTDGVVRTSVSFVLVPLSVGVNVVAFLANVWLFKVWFSVILLCVSFGIQSHFVYLFNVSILRLLAGFPVSQVHSLTELGCWMYAYFFLFRSVGFCDFQFYWANPFCF